MNRPPEPTLASPPQDAAALARLVDAHLDGWLSRRALPGNLREACRYALFGGGKRVRPLLALRSCVAVGGALEAALPVACSVELVHTFSLVHDDLPAMDDDDLRRGRPTLHRHAGEAMAILAGDAMLGMAFELVADGTAGDPARLVAIVRELARANDDMVAGQVYDTLPEFPDDMPARERLETIHRNKTRALIRAACRCGALAGGADAERLARITSYAEAIGLMFQVVDDVLDVTQTTEHLGKTARKDAVQGKLTYPGLIGLEASRAEVERLRAEAQSALAPLGQAADPLRAMCEELATRTR